VNTKQIVRDAVINFLHHPGEHVTGKTKVILVPEDKGARRRLNLKRKRINEALIIAIARVRDLPLASIKSYERKWAIYQLKFVRSVYTNRYGIKDAYVQQFIHYRKNVISNTCALLQIKGMCMVNDIVDLSLTDIEAAFRLHNIDFPHSLRVFYGVYQELVAERTT